MLGPLYGGGFVVAFLQIVALYYPAALLLHYVVPRFLPVQNIQKHERNPGDVARDAFNSLGVCRRSLLHSSRSSCLVSGAHGRLRWCPRRSHRGQGRHMDGGGAAAQARLRQPSASCRASPFDRVAAPRTHT